MTAPSALPHHPQTDIWADPGFTLRQSRIRNILRVLKQTVKPLRGDKTLPTSVGLVLIGLSLGVGVAAYNTSSNILFMTLSLMLACLILSGVLAWMNLHGARWRLVVPHHIRAGEPASVSVDLINTKRILPTYSLCFELESRQARIRTLVAQSEGLEPGESTRLVWRFTPLRHGLETIAIASLESQFPFGFLRKRISGGLEQRVVVWPQRIAYRFDPQVGARWQRQGRTVAVRGHGADLVNLRTYQRGDPVRMVHWKATARLGRLMTRETSDDRQDAYIIRIDSRKDHWPDARAFYTLCRLAASLAEDLYRRGQLSATAIDDESIRPTARQVDLFAFLDRMATLTLVEYNGASPAIYGNTVITFVQGTGSEVIIHVGNQPVGSAQTDIA